MPPLRTRADTDLLASTREGDLAAFGEIVARYQQMVCAVAFAACGQRSLSEDVAQETFVAAWKNIDSLQDHEKLKAWLCTIARRRARDAMRKRRREVLTEDGTSESEEFSTTVDDAPSPMETTATSEEEQQLWQALEGIPSSYREPLVLFYRDGQSIQNVAEDLGLSVDAVKQRLSRGRAALRDSLARVSSCLARSQPSKAFGVLVLAAISAHASSASAAGAAHAASSQASSDAFLAGRASKSSVFASASSLLALGLALLCSGALLTVVLGLSSVKPSAKTIVTDSSGADTRSSQRESDVSAISLKESDRKPQADVGGRVVDALRRPIAGATIVIGTNPTRTAQSDKRGAFLFSKVEVGSYLVQARNAEGGSQPQVVQVLDDQRDLLLQVAPGSEIEFSLVDAKAGTPLANVEVNLETGVLELSATTDARGVARFRGINSARCVATVQAAGFASSELEVFLGTEAALHKRKLALVHGVALEGVIADEQGRPIAGASVRIAGAIASTHTELTTSDDHGAFHFDTVASEASMLIATHEDYAWTTQTVLPSVDTQHERHTLVMSKGRSASGLVVYPDGSPAAFADVVSQPFGKATTTNERGEYLLAGLESAETHVRASHQFYGSSALALSKARRRSEGLVLVLEDNSLRGVVRDHHGKPIEGAQVRALRDESELIQEGGILQSAEGLSNSKGEFVLGPLPGDANFDVVAVLPGASPAYLHLAPLHAVKAHSGDSNLVIDLAAAGNITGSVSSKAGPIDDFAVTIANYSEALEMEASSPFSSTEGQFTLSEVPAGEYAVGIVAKGMAPKILKRVRVRPGDTLDLGTLSLEPGRSVRGRVLSAEGRPVANARVVTGEMISADNDHLMQVAETIDDGADPFAVSHSSYLVVQTDASGYFELSNLHQRRASLYAAAEAEGLGRSQIAKLGREGADLILRLQPTGSLAGSIANSPKESMISAIPLSHKARKSQSPLTIRSEQNSADFKLTGLAPGRYLVSAHGFDSEPDFENAQEVEVKAGQEARVVLLMSSNESSPWTDEALDAFEAQVGVLCACADEQCRERESAALESIDAAHDMMTGVAYARIMSLEDRLDRCSR